MKYLAMILLAGLLSSTAAWAEGGGKFDGTWELKYTLEGNRVKGDPSRIVELVLQGGTGTWHTQNASQKWSPCEFKDAPVVVKSATDTEAQLMVEREKGLSGCENFSLKLQLVDDKTLAGSFARGTKITGQKK